MFTTITRRFRNQEQQEAPIYDGALTGDAERPKIGLALGGGAARGWAHIGVLRALEEAGIVPDIIAGTSIGAVVGGCYLAGKLDQLEEFARSLTKRRVFRLLDISLAGSGLISGTRLQDLFAKHLEGTQIEGLGKKFVCVATELGTGHEIWLTNGRIIDAIRASYALPGIFEPIRVGHRWLVDGALVNPVPVSVCRAFGARVVIAVNLHSDVFGRGTVVYHEMHADEATPQAAEEESSLVDTVKDEATRFLKRQFLGSAGGPPGISTVMFEAFNIIQDRIARSRLAGDPPDLMLGPKLGPIGLFEFHRAEEAITTGYETTIRMVDEMNDMMVALA